MNQNCLFISNPINIQFLKDLVDDSYSKLDIGASIISFESIHNILYLAYPNINKSIIFYNKFDNKKALVIKNLHYKDINILKHYLDIINKRDLIISISLEEKILKIWNFNNLECLLSLETTNNACILTENNQNFIITNLPIQVFDFQGKKIKDIIYNSDENNFIYFYYHPFCYFMDIYFDSKLGKNYILAGGNEYIKSYDYTTNKIYKKYDNGYYNDYYLSLLINHNYKDDIIQLMGSCTSGCIDIWNFHAGELLKEIYIGNILFSICLWNSENLFVGDNESIRLIDLNKGDVIKVLKEHKNYVINIIKIKHPLYGECLISTGTGKSQIKLWINTN